MGTLQVSNVHFESTANNRIEYAGSNTVNIYAGGTNVLSANSSTMNIPVAGNISIGNSTVNTAITSTGITQNGEALSPVSGMRNKIINGNFDYWQRGTSRITTGYLADQWSEFISGATVTASRQSFTVGQTDVPGEPKYYHRTVTTTASSASEAVIVSSVIESCRTLAGQTATLSFWAKADSSKNIAVEFVQHYGSGGSPSAFESLTTETFSLTSSWQKFTVTVDIPSISGKTLGTTHDGYLNVLFWFSGGSDYNARTNSLGTQSGTFDLAQVQLEAGSVATPFEQRPIGTELALCQRYYQIAKASARAYTGDGYWGLQFVFKTQMRTTPTLGTPTGGNNSLPVTYQGSIITDDFQAGVQWTGSGAGTFYCYGITMTCDASF